MNKNARRLAKYTEYNWLRERGRLPTPDPLRPAKKKREKRRGVEQDLGDAPDSPKPTPEEDDLARIFEAEGIRFERQFCVKLGRKRKRGMKLYAFLDFWLPDARIAVEVDGFHHRKKEDDFRTMRILNAAPWISELYRLWNSEIPESSKLDALLARARR